MPGARRIRSGESGALPIVVGLIVIIIFFQAERSQFDSAINLVNLFQQASIYILLGAAEVFALVLSEIDLSVGFVLAVGGFITLELIASPINLPWWVGILGGVGATAVIGYIRGPDHQAARSIVRRHARRAAGLGGRHDRACQRRQVRRGRRDLGHSYEPRLPPREQQHEPDALMDRARRGAGGLRCPLADALPDGVRRGAPPVSITLLTIAVTAIVGILLVYVCTINRGLLVSLKGVPWVIPFVGLVLFRVFPPARTNPPRALHVRDRRESRGRPPRRHQRPADPAGSRSCCATSPPASRA